MPTQRRSRPTIVVFRHHGVYCARFSDPNGIVGFEQDTIPTTFTRDADPLAVLAHTACDNPAADVVLVHASPATEPYPVDLGICRNKQMPS